MKHLSRAGLSMDRFEMLLVTAQEAWHISRPLVDFGMRQPVGVGDVTSGLLLVKLLQGATLRDALEHVTAAVYEIMLATKNMQEYELQVVAAQDRIAQPGTTLAPPSFKAGMNLPDMSGKHRVYFSPSASRAAATAGRAATCFIQAAILL